MASVVHFPSALRHRLSKLVSLLCSRNALPKLFVRGPFQAPSGSEPPETAIQTVSIVRSMPNEAVRRQ